MSQTETSSYRKRYQARWLRKKSKMRPWYSSWRNAIGRCTKKSHLSYRYYGGRGIKCLMSEEDVKTLWFRDSAFNLEWPCLDRIDSNGDYSLENCQFIEFSENSRRANKARKNNCKENLDNGKDEG